MIWLALKITVTIAIFACIAICTWLIISEIIEYKNWMRLIVEVLFMIVSVVDILIMWFL